MKDFACWLYCQNHISEILLSCFPMYWWRREHALLERRETEHKSWNNYFIHQHSPARFRFSNPLNLLEQHTINKTHEKDMLKTHAKNPIMTPTSTAPVSTDDKQEKVNGDGILEEQQKTISYLKRKVGLLEEYSQWPCLFISGLVKPGEEDELQKVATTIENETGIVRNAIIRNIDKAHPIG